ncbi:glycopeptide antibiotics resistance protein [Bacillus pakistanensis]|uniref:Glycopeptide antibiotics resistance protein n=1 Tax=Rossellomorea pakistanensis TaxID=992288 RepID=A0ABS2NID9_9BACI|nr:VanZ family protein [Bacillus pakistanensis]MBM7587626.1 glycopeptide antibiotics resistance protein [Bacillus pakistanensis]
MGEPNGFFLIVSDLGISYDAPRFIFNLSDVHHNYIPFDTIRTYLFNFNHYNLDTWLYNTFGVVFLFIPLGFLLPSAFFNIKSNRTVVLISLSVSMFIEVLQRVTNLGVFDIDDMILNTIGAAVGYWIYKSISKNKKAHIP